MTESIQQFYDRAHRIFDLAQAQQALDWDQQVMMPPRGLDQRAHQLAALAAVVHEQVADPAYGEIIARLETRDGLSEDLRADLREARRSHDRGVKIPVRLVQARAEACALAQAAWTEARAASDFARFQPHLETVLALTREEADALGAANRYDALLDDYEPGMTEAQLAAVFQDLKGRLAPLLETVRGAARVPDAGILARTYPVEAQRAFCLRLVGDLGFDLQAGRFDVSEHPFTNGTLRDVRLTTRYQPGFLPSALFGTIHEAGHGLYEQGLDPARYRDPAGQACSMGIHESQSRLWENLVGRSRPFWSHYYGPLRAAFPGVLDDVPLDAFYGAVNAVAPSLVRVEADEATYNLHIILRFELESDLLAGRLEVRDLPGRWRDKMKQYLGIEPPDDRSGVLQDIHWSAGLIGYFPTYALGNLYAAQFLERMRQDLPDLDARIARGDLGAAKDWLNRNIHVHGRRWTAQDLCRRVTGAPLSAEPLMRHLWARCGEVYGVAAG
jgi:carboxypeptidase Taq